MSVVDRRTILLALALAGCATTPAAPEPEFHPTGEVLSYDRNASFDATRVKSVFGNMRMREDGSWGGVLANKGVDVSVDDVTVRGVDLFVSREESRKGKTIITAQIQGNIYRFEFVGDRALIRTPSVSLTFDGRVGGQGYAKYGTMGELTLKGDASKENPPWPQFAFALIAAFGGGGM